MKTEASSLFDIEFPIFHESPKPYLPDLSLDQVELKIEELKTWFPDSMPTPEERLKQKVDVPFVLKD